MTKLSYLIIVALMAVVVLANSAHGRKVVTPGHMKTKKKSKKSPKSGGIRRRRLLNAQNKNEELKNNKFKQGYPTPSLVNHATPFGEIEEVFVDTLKEDEEYDRRLQTFVEPLSFEFVVVEPVEVEKVEVVEVPKCAGTPVEIIGGPSKGKGKRGYKYGPSKGKSKYGYGGKGKGKSKYRYGGSGGKGKGKRGYKYSGSGSYSGEDSGDKLPLEVDGGKVVAIEEITYYGSGPNAKPCVYGDPKHPCPFSGPQDDDMFP